jgi:hypothetical protein
VPDDEWELVNPGVPISSNSLAYPPNSTNSKVTCAVTSNPEGACLKTMI